MTRAASALIAVDLAVPRSRRIARVRAVLVAGTMPEGSRRALFGLLDREERERAWEIRSEPRRIRFITGHGLRRRMLSALEPSVRPDEWRFGSSVHGRPFPLQRSDCDASLSYSRDVTAVAVVRGCRIGIDIQLTAEPNLADAMLEQREARRPVTGFAAPPLRAEAWAMLEARVKCAGLGLDDEAVRRWADGASRQASPDPRVGMDLAAQCMARVSLGERRVHLAVAVAGVEPEDGRSSHLDSGAAGWTTSAYQDGICGIVEADGVLDPPARIGREFVPRLGIKHLDCSDYAFDASLGEMFKSGP
jgi:phosphopantetheinyl transferase